MKKQFLEVPIIVYERIYNCGDSMRDIYLTGILGIFIIAFLLSCGDDEVTTTTGTGPDPADTIDTFSIVCLLPVYDSLVRLDSLSISGATISWDTISNEAWYRVYVYDSLNNTVPAHIVITNGNTCTISRYEIGQTYWVRVFAVRDTILIDSTRVTTPFGTVILADISFSKASFPGFDTADTNFKDVLDYNVYIKSTDSFTIQIDTTLIDPAIVVAPDTYIPEFKIGFYVYPSPVNVQFSDSKDLVVSLSWDSVTGEDVKGYRAYLRDYNGIIIQSQDIPDSLTSGAFSGLDSNGAYKINIATLSSLGPGPLDSNFLSDVTDSNSIRLPYVYYSTYRTPVNTNDSNLVAGVPGGIFLMGNIWTGEEGALSKGAVPVHEVIVSSFYLSKHEIMCQQYAQFLNEEDDSCFLFDGSILKFNTVSIADTSKETWFISYVNDSFVVEAGKDSFPVLSLYWYGAAAYCNWLSKKYSLDTCYDSTWECDFSRSGYRLPTEAEFEYLASSAFTGSRKLFPWGHDWHIDSAAVGGKSVEKVGSYNPYYGFYDLVGSAMEYVNDRSDDLTGLYLDNSSYYIFCKQLGVVIDPAGPTNNEGYKHMMRGGSFTSNEAESAVYYRYIHPSDRLVDYGFRVARNAE